MTVLLTDNLALLAGAPNGIKKLRKLILELAVRGKLVPQDSNDEPASELLKRITEDKARLVAEGKIKKQKHLTDAPEPVVTFPLPVGWAATSIGEATICRDGERVPVSQAEREGRDKVFDYYGASGVIDKIDSYLFDKPLLLVGEDGANLINRNTPIAFMARGRYWVNNHAHVLDGISDELLRYIELYFNAIDLKPYVTGTAQPKMNQSKMNGIPVGLPPVAEQHRIVTKVDELMALCNRLEGQQANAESAHAQLVQALLDSLTQAIDATDFATNWQRLAKHFHTLFTTESSIDALRKTLLYFAADGRLVSSSAPAEYLALSDVIDADSLNGSSKKPQDAPGAIEILRISAGTGVEDFLTDENEHKWADVSEAEMKKFLLAKDDLLACRFNGNLHYVGAFSLYCRTRGVPQIFPDKLIRFRANRSKALPHYLKYILNAAPARAQIESFCATTVGNIGISAKNLKTIKLRLPSLQEQRKIVDLLDELLALCDQLKSRVVLARQLNAQLASTLFEHALVDKSQQTPAVSDQQSPRTLLAAEITHRLRSQRTFGQRKLQKVIYLAEHAAKLATIKGNYLRDAAGPHDRQLMNKVEGEMQKHQWYERIERETVGHAYRPLSQAGQHRQGYRSAWSAAEQATIEQIIELMRNWDTDRCEMTVTLYAAWNDFILEGRPISDEAIVGEVMHSWNDTKLRFGKTQWLAVLTEMKKHKILIPTGFGKRTTGGMLSLAGFE